jgi:hypothetical protein
MLVDVPEGSKLCKGIFKKREYWKHAMQSLVPNIIPRETDTKMHPLVKKHVYFSLSAPCDPSRSICVSTWNSSNYEWHTAVLNNGTLPSYYVEKLASSACIIQKLSDSLHTKLANSYLWIGTLMTSRPGTLMTLMDWNAWTWKVSNLPSAILIQKNVREQLDTPLASLSENKVMVKVHKGFGMLRQKHFISVTNSQVVVNNVRHADRGTSTTIYLSTQTLLMNTSVRNIYDDILEHSNSLSVSLFIHLYIYIYI